MYKPRSYSPSPCLAQVPSVYGGSIHGVVTRDWGGSNDALNRVGRYVTKPKYAEILFQATHPGCSQAEEASGRAQSAHVQAASHNQGPSPGEVVARGTSLGHTEHPTLTAMIPAPVAFAGEHAARHLPGGLVERASKTLADKHPGRTQAEVRGRAESTRDEATCDSQGRSWAEVARGTNISLKEGQIQAVRTMDYAASAGGGSAESPSKAPASGAGGTWSVSGALTKVLGAVGDVWDLEWDGQEKIRQCPKAFLAWVSAQNMLLLLFFARLSPSKP